MPLYAKKLVDNGASIDCIWGFVDGTLRRTARPVRYQRRLYSGHKRVHGIKFQGITTPDGMIAYLYGPVCGSRHDSSMLADSQLIHQLNECFPLEDGRTLAIYGDPAYPESNLLIVAYRDAPRRSFQRQFNKSMNKMRTSVEWGFKDILKHWKYLEYKAAMKVLKMPVAKYYMVAAFLTNINCCIYGNQSTNHFMCEPLSLNDYLGLVNH